MDKEIKIYICCHKASILPAGRYFFPIQVGTALTANRLPHMLRDNKGDNISDRNQRYNELTAQYWAWKNDRSEYVGFCHYRRYFSFSPEHYEAEIDGVLRDILNEKVSAEFCMNDSQRIREVVHSADILLTEPMRFETAGIENLTVYRQFGVYSGDLRMEDILTAVAVLKEQHPEFSEAADTYLNGTWLYPCNMFIMKREIFERYCAWLFPILEETEHRIDYTGYSPFAMRTIGHIAERLLGVFCTYLQQNEPECRIACLQRVFLKETDPAALRLYPVTQQDDFGVGDALCIWLKKQRHTLFPRYFMMPDAPAIGVRGTLKALFRKGLE